MKNRFVLIRVIAAVAVLTLAVGVPTASAANERKQNRSIKKNKKNISKNKKNIRKHNRAIKRHTRGLSGIRKAAKATDDTVAALKIVAERGDKNASAILAVAPSIIDGLNQLKTGLEAAGAGLLSLKTLATSTEYGIGQVFIGPTAAGGAFVVTPDIPDAVQQAQTTQRFLASSAGAITVQVGVRSAESDGTGPALPAAHCRVTVVAGSNTMTSSANAAIGGAPFYPIDTKSPQTSTTETGFPFGPISTDVLTDLTQSGTNATAVPGAPTAVAGESYSVSLSCVDLSADAADPSA